MDFLKQNLFQLPLLNQTAVVIFQQTLTEHSLSGQLLMLLSKGERIYDNHVYERYLYVSTQRLLQYKSFCFEQEVQPTRT